MMMLMVMMVPAAALALLMAVVMRVIVATAAFTLLVIVVVMTAPAFALAFLMIMVVPAAALALLMAVVMRVIVAAAAFTLLVIVVVMAAPAFARLVIVMMMVSAAPAAALALLMMMVMPAAAASTAAALLGLVAELDRIERRLDGLHLKADHLEHLSEIGQRQHRKSLVDLREAHAAVDQGPGGLAKNVEVARDVKNLLDGGTDGPEGALLVDEAVAHFNGTALVGRNGERDVARRGVDRLGENGALGGREGQGVGLVKNRLGGGGLSRKKLGKRGHESILRYQSSGA